MEVLTRFLLISLLTFTVVQTPQDPEPDIKTSLDLLKKANNLTDWLYTRIDYSNINRRKSLSFLMKTEQDAWRKAKTPDEHGAWLMLLSNQGYNQLFSGNILESINSYEHAYNYWAKHNLNIEITDYILKPWANNYTRLGDYEKALFIQQKILDFAIKEHDNELAASTYNNMAISYRSLADFKKAEEYIRLGILKTDAASTVRILLDNTLADIYKDKNDLSNAERIINANIARQKKQQLDIQTAYWLLSSYITAGNIQLAKGNYSAAEKYYHLGLSINDQYYKGNRLREKANIITELGKIKLNQGKAAEAINYFNQTLSTFGLLNASGSVNESAIFGDNRIIDVFYQKALAYLNLGDDQSALQNIRLSLFAVDKIRFELADVKTKQRFQGETKQMAEKAIEIAFKLLERTKQHHYAEVILDIIEKTKARTLLDDIRRNQQQLTLQTKDSLFLHKQRLERAITYNEKQLLQDPEEIRSLTKNNADLKFKLESIEKQLREKYPALETFKEAKTSASSGIIKELPQKTHIIEFFMGKEVIYVVEVKNRQIKHIKKIVNALPVKNAVNEFVDTFYRHGPAAMLDQPKQFFMASNSIYKTLLADFELQNSKQVIIIPDEILGHLSFDGLITEDKYTSSISTWPYLIKKTSLSYAFSIQTLLNQSERKQNNSKAFAGLFITHENKGTKYIPAVAKEAESIKKLVAGDFITGKDADVNHFFEAFDKASVLHISTHSYLSGLQQEPTLAFEDNQVFLFELSARKTAPSLVVLSACRTADGIMASGEGIISLSRGFAAIGTQGTIAGLWNVNDEAAAAITADTYQNLIDGKEISNALHQAKLNWLNGKRNGEQEYLPYYWDSLIFIGHDQKLPIEPAGLPIRILLIIGSAILLVSGIIYLVLKRLRPKAAR
ncbi:CHAT domain-containing tetratricopeptide repeat protein [Pedobacter frigoris]|uniref:CHAT domain-containing protein n=1 Tax=Pedobacter frigoris TaxID=2571272 RepID=UPI002930AA98|nr:CHAT domain-containing tetratricopeptide repeat protein [Pedobacter frigoris]